MLPLHWSVFHILVRGWQKRRRPTDRAPVHSGLGAYSADFATALGVAEGIAIVRSVIMESRLIFGRVLGLCEMSVLSGRGGGRRGGRFQERIEAGRFGEPIVIGRADDQHGVNARVGVDQLSAGQAENA